MGHTWVPADGRPLLGVREAMARSVVAENGPESALPSDAGWTAMRAPVLDELRCPRGRAGGASLALHRLRTLLALVP